MDYMLNIGGDFDNSHSFVDNNCYNCCMDYMAAPFPGEGEERQIVVGAVAVVGDGSCVAFGKLLQYSDY